MSIGQMASSKRCSDCHVIIPRIIHQVWVGDNPLPPVFQHFIELWKEFHPEWEYMFWDNESVKTLEVNKILRKAQHNSAKSNAIRAEVIMKFGGVYIDLDTEPLKSIDPLLEDITAFATRESKDRVNCAVFGATRGHKFATWQYSRLEDWISKAGPWGPQLAGQAYEACYSDCTLFPKHFFYPYDYGQLNKRGSRNYPKSYAVHHWALTWNKGKTWDKVITPGASVIKPSQRKQQLKTKSGTEKQHIKKKKLPLDPIAKEVTVLLCAYKRVQYLDRQVEAIKKQSVEVKDVVVWNNGALLSDKQRDGLIVIDSPKNWGVWARFTFALELQSEFICVIDDDTIPGHDWLKNCLQSMEIREGLYGTCGVVFKHEKNRNPHIKYGWSKPSANILQVDMIGHSWFFKKEWLRFYHGEERLGHSTCGEDYHFSYALQAQGIGTYVPPHPKDERSMWGSLQPEFNDDKHGLSRSSKEETKKVETHARYLQAGWRTLYMEEISRRRS